MFFCLATIYARARKLFRRGDDAVVAAEVHEGEEAEQTVVVGVEVAVVEGLVLHVP